MEGIRIYIEGGGDGKETKAQLRLGFQAFFKDLYAIARSLRIHFDVITCGSRKKAYDAFITALETHPNSFNVLLVDSEGPVNTEPWQHLKVSDDWDSPGLAEKHCHLMVQAMEAWFFSDLESLSRFYGKGFNPNPIPRNQKVEQIPKKRLEMALKSATKDTTKGEYHKTRHAPKILECLDAPRVRKASPHCERLFATLAREMGVAV